MPSGARPPFYNPRLDWSNSLTALLKHAWFAAPLTGAISASSNLHLQDITRRGPGWNAYAPTGGTYTPAGIVGQRGFGLQWDGSANTRLLTINDAERYGGDYTGPITIASWIKTAGTIIDYGAMLSKYTSTSFHYGFDFVTYNNTGRANTFGLSYYNSASGGQYHEAHAGADVLSGNETVLLAWSGKFGTASSHVLYKNGKAFSPTWFTNNGTAALTDPSDDPEPYWFGNTIWSEQFGNGGIIYSVMLWDRILSASEHMALYDPQTRFSFIEPQAPPKFWSIPYFIVSNSASSSKSAYTSGTSGGTSTSSSKSAFLAGQTPYALRPDGDITDGAWLTQASGTDLYTAIDEPSWIDTDYVWHEQAVAGSSFEVSLSNPGVTPGAGNHIIRWRAARIANNRTVTVKCELVQNTTVIATSTQQLTSSAQTFEYTLTSGEVSSITDYNDLRLRFTITTIT